jgi:putative hydrolase of the HAD superfamily
VTITHVFFDIGGVLGSNGWDQEQRAAAVTAFGLDAVEFAGRHAEVSGPLESGAMDLDEYLRCTVFNRPRAFTPDDFLAFMYAQSIPYPETVALARGLAETKRWQLATLNNESEALNLHRVRAFGLAGIFGAYYTSCWLGALKPSHRIYQLALAIAQADPAATVFIDDRERNLETARALGMLGVHYTGVTALRADLAALGITT